MLEGLLREYIRLERICLQNEGKWPRDGLERTMFIIIGRRSHYRLGGNTGKSRFIHFQ